MIISKDEFKTVFLTFLVWLFSGFDLILLTLVSVEVQKLYFPNTDQTVSILAIYGTLSLSLLGRVFGGIYFSRLADIHGRKPVVMVCLMISEWAKSSIIHSMMKRITILFSISEKLRIRIHAFNNGNMPVVFVDAIA